VYTQCTTHINTTMSSLIKEKKKKKKKRCRSFQRCRNPWRDYEGRFAKAQTIPLYSASLFLYFFPSSALRQSRNDLPSSPGREAFSIRSLTSALICQFQHRPIIRAAEVAHVRNCEFPVAHTYIRTFNCCRC